MLPVVAAAIAALVAAVPEVVRRREIGGPAKLAIGVGIMLALGASTSAVLQAGPATAAMACNGHVELCDRHYDEVVQAATHNAMSSPETVDIWPEHDRGIRAQLDYGVRVLLIDTKYWTPVDVPAELGGAERYLPPAVAQRLFDDLGDRRVGRPGSYLCHASCALGAIELTAALRQVRAFLEENRAEVLTLIVQNAISPADTTAAFDQAGLLPLMFAHEPDDHWPTLGELVAADRRLIVFSEIEATAAPGVEPSGLPVHPGHAVPGRIGGRSLLRPSPM